MPTTVSREHGGHRLRPHRRQQLRAGRPAGRPWVASAWSLWICEAICKHELGTTCTKTLQGRMIALGMGSNALQAGVAIEHAACGRSAAVRTMQQTVRLWRCGLLLGSISRCQTTVRHRVVNATCLGRDEIFEDVRAHSQVVRLPRPAVLHPNATTSLPGAHGCPASIGRRCNK